MGYGEKSFPVFSFWGVDSGRGMLPLLRSERFAQATGWRFESSTAYYHSNDNLNGVRGKKFPRVFVLGGRFRKGDAPPPEKRAVCASDGLEVRILHGLPPFEQTTLMGYGEKVSIFNFPP